MLKAIAEILLLGIPLLHWNYLHIRRIYEITASYICIISVYITVINCLMLAFIKYVLLI